MCSFSFFRCSFLSPNAFFCVLFLRLFILLTSLFFSCSFLLSFATVYILFTVSVLLSSLFSCPPGGCPPCRCCFICAVRSRFSLLSKWSQVSPRTVEKRKLDDGMNPEGRHREERKEEEKEKKRRRKGKEKRAEIVKDSPKNRAMKNRVPVLVLVLVLLSFICPFSLPVHLDYLHTRSTLPLPSS